MHLILVAPALLAQPPAALAASAALATLAHHAARPQRHTSGIARTLLDTIGAPDATPAAPLAALGAGVDVDTDHVLFADPVLLAADRDDLVLIQRVDDLSDDEAIALVAMLNGHFEADDVRFVAPRPDAWFARSVAAPQLVTTPFDVARAHGVFPHLPRGADAGVWKRWQNEISMLLHDHPLNVARREAGRPEVTGIWFSDGGGLGDATELPAVAATAAPGRAGDVTLGVAQHAGGVIRPFVAGAGPLSIVDHPTPVADSIAVAVAGPVGDAGAIARFDAQWIAPALALLAAKRIARLSLIADGDGAVCRWTVLPPTLVRRLAARARRRPFALPAIDG